MTALLREQPFFGSLALRLPVRPDAGRETLASDGREIRYSPHWIAETDAHRHRDRDRPGGAGLRAQAPYPAGRSATRSAGSAPPSSSPTACCATPGSPCRPMPRPGTGSASRTPTTGCRSRTKANPAPAIRRAPGEAPTPIQPARPMGHRAATRPTRDDDGGQSGDGDGGEADGSAETSNGDVDTGDNSDGAGVPASCDPSGTGEVMDAPADAGDGNGESGPSPAGDGRRRGTGVGRGDAPGAQPGQGPRARRPGADRGDGPRAPMRARWTGARCCAAS